MDSKVFRDAAYRAIDFIADYHDNVADLPVRCDVSPGYLLSQLPAQAPNTTEAWSDIERDLHEAIIPGLCHWTHPGFMAYFPASSTFEGILGELYSAAFNNPAFDWICSPAITELEMAMGDWVGEMLGLPEAFMGNSAQPGCGVIQGTTTECLIVTMVTARDRTLKAMKFSKREDKHSDLRTRLVVLSSSETHVSTRKAAAVVGVKHHPVHCDPSSGMAMTGDQLLDAVHLCLSKGLIPFYATITFGTTNSCAIDDFRGIADVKAKHPDIWMHVDAAYAGAALACAEFRPYTAGMDRFDSFSVNLGKWLLTNLDCTMLFVQKASAVVDSMSNDCAIVANDISATRAMTDFRDLQLSMGRRFRSLKIWFVLRSWGKEGIQQNIRQHVEMAASFAGWVNQRPDLFTHVTKPQLALNVIRVSDQAAHEMGTDASSATLQLYNIINVSRQIWLSKTIINGCTSIRVIAANPKSNLTVLQSVFDLLSKELSILIRERQ